MLLRELHQMKRKHTSYFVLSETLTLTFQSWNESLLEHGWFSDKPPFSDPAGKIVFNRLDNWRFFQCCCWKHNFLKCIALGAESCASVEEEGVSIAFKDKAGNTSSRQFIKQNLGLHVAWLQGMRLWVWIWQHAIWILNKADKILYYKY